MDDTRIIDLYWQRSERAIAETDAKYGAYCRMVALNITGDTRDGEECVSDTWLAAWNSMSASVLYYLAEPAGARQPPPDFARDMLFNQLVKKVCETFLTALIRRAF